jgi:hypothetical protein
VALGSDGSGVDERRTGRNGDGVVAGAYEKWLGGTSEKWAWVAQCRAAQFKLELNRSKFKRIQFYFKFLQTFLDLNRTFPCSKNLKENMVGTYLR